MDLSLPKGRLFLCLSPWNYPCQSQKLTQCRTPDTLHVTSPGIRSKLFPTLPDTRRNMVKSKSGYRWFVIAIFFFFMLLHQTDKLMIGSLQIPISETFGINNQQWGLVNSGALIVATILYPI